MLLAFARTFDVTGCANRRWQRTFYAEFLTLREDAHDGGGNHGPITVCFIAAANAALVERHPMLAEPWRLAEGFPGLALPHRAVIHTLMGIESDVVMDTLVALRERGILGLPMHDGVLVPASAETVACELLIGARTRFAGLVLRLDVDRAQLGSGDLQL